MMRWAVCVVILVAGCTAAPGSQDPEAPLAGPGGPAAVEARSQEARATGLRLSGCIGMSVFFYFDAQAAKAAVPPPFEPTMSVDRDIGPFGVLEHRACQARLNGSDLGPVALAIGSVMVDAPAEMSNGSAPYYIMRLATDHPALADYFAGHGLPATAVDADDASLWAAPGVGAMDSRMAGDRIVGVVADSAQVSTSGTAPELFYKGGNITRWTFEQQSSGGDIAQAILLLDESVWGWRTSPNLLFSSYVADALQEHEFVHFPA